MTTTRIQLALNVNDIAAATEFYTRLCTIATRQPPGSDTACAVHIATQAAGPGSTRGPHETSLEIPRCRGRMRPSDAPRSPGRRRVAPVLALGHSPCVPGRRRAGSVHRPAALTVCGRRACPPSPATA
jgi:hypothetical protein